MENILRQVSAVASSVPLGTWAGSAAVLWILSTLSVVVYRLQFHPLARFPGPKLAAITLWYETYHDVWLRGKYVFKIKEMHEKYGPIVRINPHEVHIDDCDGPEFYHDFYSSRELKKDPWYYKVSGVAEVSFATEDRDVHRRRVGGYRDLFAPGSIDKFEPQIKVNIGKLCNVLEEKAKTREQINVLNAYRVLTFETIASYIGLAPDPLLEDENWGEDYGKFARIVTESSVLVRHFPLLAYFRLLPGWFVTRLSSDFGILKNHLDRLRVQVESACDESETPEKTPYSTMIHGIIGNERHSKDEIFQEAFLLLGAGTNTTAQLLAAATLYILNDTKVTTLLQEELAKAIPDPTNIPPLRELKRIKYLDAVIKEAHRVCPPASSRLPRINHDKATKYKEWIIPRGTTMSMNIWNCHRNEAIFPDPEKFDPERWLDKSNRLERYLVPFGSGPRMCIGRNLSYAEQYLVLGTIFRKFNFKLFGTGPEDVAIVSSSLVSHFPPHSKGVRVTVHER